MKWLVCWAAALVVVVVLDLIWLRWAGPNFFRPAIGHLMAREVSILPAAVFYLLYAVGIAWFAVRPGDGLSPATALLNGAMLGLLCYATFDLTNHAIMRDWPLRMTLVDIAWGTFATALASGAAAWVTIRVMARFPA